MEERKLCYQINDEAEPYYCWYVELSKSSVQKVSFKEITGRIQRFVPWSQIIVTCEYFEDNTWRDRNILDFYGTFISWVQFYKLRLKTWIGKPQTIPFFWILKIIFYSFSNYIKLRKQNKKY